MTPRHRRLAAIAALCGLFATGSPGMALAAELTVTVRNVANAKGKVLVAVCTRETFLTPKCPYTASADARAGDVAVMIQNVPAGRYALQSFHDENGNGAFDRNFLGIPEEGIGFGNDAPIRLGPPGYDEAELTVTGLSTRIALSLRYLIGR
jgi:uncharacterized protein (DUF2141 family)